MSLRKSLIWKGHSSLSNVWTHCFVTSIVLFFFIFRSLKKCFTKVNFKRVYVSKRKIRINKKSSGLQRYTMHLSVESSVTQTKKNTFRHNFFKNFFSFFFLYSLSCLSSSLQPKKPKKRNKSKQENFIKLKHRLIGYQKMKMSN